MSVKQGLLALLAEAPAGAYQLRKEFEARTGGTWPLNIGQVYTTLQRLERDGLVAALPASPDGGEPYELTAEGRASAEHWWLTPVQRGTAERDELVIKLALALASPGVDIAAIVQAQRAESMRALRDLTRLKMQVPEPPSTADHTWSLLLDHRIFATEAEIRWLDHLETAARLAPRPRRGRHADAPAEAPPATSSPHASPTAADRSPR